MRYLSRSHIISIGLAIFSMLFGAGNLMYPLMVGMTAGSNTFFGMVGFLLTAVCLPVAGLIAMILFDGDYYSFFNRLGKIPSKFFVYASIGIIGPIIGIPRIITLSHTMIAPFLPIATLQEINYFSSFMFALLFLFITFFMTFRENRIIDVLGYVVSPILLLSLIVIITKGLLSAETIVLSMQSPLALFKQNLVRGYETLDLLATIFFSSVVIHILKNTIGNKLSYNQHGLTLIGFKAGTIGVGLLGIIYTGMSILGMYHGHGLENANAGELFREIAFNILGSGGALLISTAVLMACLSTSVALCAVYAEFVQRTVFKNKIGYVSALILALLSCIPLSIYGLNKVLTLTAGPIVYVGYPLIIALTICNIAYKLVGFKPVRIPVLITFAITTYTYLKSTGML